MNLEYHERQCFDIFGDVVDPSAGVAAIIQRYGGDQPHGHKIFYANGADDPWQRASVVTTLSEDQPAFLAQCDLCGHCGDLHDGDMEDPLPRRLQKHEIISFIGKWLREYNVAQQSMNSTKRTNIKNLHAATADAPDMNTVASPVSFLVLLPIFGLFMALKSLLHVDLVREVNSVRTSLL